MNWNNFEENMKSALNAPPPPSDAELDSSWDGLEPKIFPRKSRKGLWFSLSSILLLMVLSLMALNKYGGKNEVMLAEKSPSLSNSTPAASNQTYVLNTSDQKPAETSGVKEPDQVSDEKIESMPATSTNKASQNSSSTSISTNSSQSKNNAIDNNFTQNNSSSTNEKSGTADNSSSKNNINVLKEDKASTDSKSDLISYASRKETMADAEVLTTSTQSEAPEIELGSQVISRRGTTITEERKNEKIFETKRVNIDSEEYVADVFIKEKSMPDDEDIDVALENNETPQKAKVKKSGNIIGSIKDNVNNEESQVKISKPLELRVKTAYFMSTKAAYPYTGGILGLEVLQELSNKLHLLAGLRFRYATLNKNLIDSSVNSNIYHRVDNSSPGKTTFYYYQYTDKKEYKIGNAQIIEVPIYIGYDLLQKLMVQMGVDISYLLDAGVTLNKSWTTQKDLSAEVDNQSAANFSAPQSPYSFDPNAFKNKFGLSFHIGLEYSISPRLFATFALDKMLMNYFKSDFTTGLQVTTAAPQIQLGLGYRIKGKKE